MGGEYFFKNQRKGKVQTDDDRLYGVFAEASSDEELGGGGRYVEEKTAKLGSHVRLTVRGALP